MGLWDKIKGELIDIIEWVQPSQSDVLAYKFPRYQNEIKNGAKLTVREGQVAILVNEGQLADVYPPGMHTLETNNMPVLSTIKGWKYGFHSPFKVDVYFINMRQWTDLKWGTSNPIMLRDPEFGPVRVRAFGTYAMQVGDPATFLRQLVSTDPSFETYEIENQLRNTIVARLVDVLGQAKVAVLDLAGNYDKIAQVALARIKPDLEQMGLKLTTFYVENISLPPEVEAALDTRTKMGVLGDMNQFTRYQAATAIPEAAKNPGGLGGIGAQLAAGLAVGQQAAGAIGGALQPGATPPPLPASVAFFVALNGQQAGPFDLASLQTHVRDGSLTRSSLVWRQGMGTWQPAETVSELQSLFAAVPPPLPTPPPIPPA
jgi:membrane protease subunit (stomatin/prohibitin family)